MLYKAILCALSLPFFISSPFILFTSSASALNIVGFADPSTNDRQEHRVGPLPWDKGQTPISESYAGHFPIRRWKQKDGKTADASQFYWFFPATKPRVKNPPLVMRARKQFDDRTLYENGPIHMTENGKLGRNNITWTQDYSMLFIDQPVGTGFSFVNNGQSKKEDSDIDDDGDGDDDDENNNNSSLDALDLELERDQAQESAYFARLPSDQSFHLKAMASQQDRQSRNESSYTEGGFVKDQAGVTEDMLTFLDLFYERYPEQLKSDLYIAGQSYAGKFVPSIAHGILERNKKNRQQSPPSQTTPKKAVIQIKGISLGNTLTDPITQIQYHADHAYYQGLLTPAEWKQMHEYQKSAVSLTGKGQFLEANRYRGKIFNLFRNSTDLNTFDLGKGSHPMNWKLMDEFLNTPAIKDSLNIFGPRSSYLKANPSRFPSKQVQTIEAGRKATEFKTDPEVKKAMRGDIMRSTKPFVEDLLKNKIKVLAYQGMFDYRDPPAGSTDWIEGLDWEGKDAFLKSERKVWKVRGFVAGFVNSATVPSGAKKNETEVTAAGDDGSGLTRIVMWGGGHYTPMDQPENSLIMIRHLIDGTRLDLSLDGRAKLKKRSAL